MKKLLKINFIFVLFAFNLSFKSSQSSENSSANPLCLASHCGSELFQCGLDNSCRNWLSCVLQCGDDKIRCPSICGFYHQGSKINKTSQCIFKSQCVDLGFAEFPTYDHKASAQLFPLKALMGQWWFQASYGGSHIFDLSCQRFHFGFLDSETLKVDFSVPLALNGRQKMSRTRGVFKSMPDGSVKVFYDNFSGYHELWYLVDATAESVLAHVCLADSFAPQPICYDYGTIYLTRRPFFRPDFGEAARLDELTKNQYGFGWDQMHFVGQESCPQNPNYYY